MKIKLILSIITIAMGVGIVACNDDFLNTEPTDRILNEAIWTDGAHSEAFIFNVYSYLYYGGFEEEMLASLSDEAMFTHSGRGFDVFNGGSSGPANQGKVSNSYEWDDMYLAIRQANVAITELPESTFDDDVLRDRLLGEAYFLRAYYYHQLLRYYGGVPLIDRPYGLDEDYSIARNTYADCVDFIVADLDQAATLLEGKEETKGRASRLAALALKARMLLYAASDLADGPTAQAKSEAHASYSNIELVAYPEGDRDARWIAARNAAQKVFNEGTGGYKLDLGEPVSFQEGVDNYVALSMGGGSAAADLAGAADLIFERTHSAAYSAENDWPLGGIHFGVNNGPNGYHNWAGNTPIQQLVDDYEMMDGSKFDWSNKNHSADPYANRDPRFYATILYDGADWKPRPGDVADRDPANQVQTGFYDDGAEGIIPGLDTRQSPVEDWNGSRTHYYVRKFIDPNPEIADVQSSAQLVPWPFLRYTEMAFIIAEAALELGNEGVTRDWLNKIRYRAGMPGSTASGTELRELLINERRIELAYEEHRYHDARRWMIAPATLGRVIQQIDISATLIPGQTPHVPYRHDKSVYEYTYTVSNNTDNELRTWRDKMYFRAILRNEINRNQSLIQNPGY